MVMVVATKSYNLKVWSLVGSVRGQKRTDPQSQSHKEVVQEHSTDPKKQSHQMSCFFIMVVASVH